MGDAPEVDGRAFIQAGKFEIGDIVAGAIVGAGDYDIYVDTQTSRRRDKI
jgi:hypothetical protein